MLNDKKKFLSATFKETYLTFQSAQTISDEHFRFHYQCKSSYATTGESAQTCAVAAKREAGNSREKAKLQYL